MFTIQVGADLVRSRRIRPWERDSREYEAKFREGETRTLTRAQLYPICTEMLCESTQQVRGKQGDS